MYCLKCGAELPDEARFCDKCGAKIEIRPIDIPNEKRTKPKNSLFIILGIILVFAIAVGAFFVLKPKKPGVVETTVYAFGNMPFRIRHNDNKRIVSAKMCDENGGLYEDIYFEYDSDGRLITERENEVYEHNYTYNEKGSLISYEMKSSLVKTHKMEEYDNDGYLIKATGYVFGEIEADLIYDANKLLTEYKLIKDGIQSSFSFEYEQNTGKLKKIKSYDETGVQVQAFDVEYADDNSGFKVMNNDREVYQIYYSRNNAGEIERINCSGIIDCSVDYDKNKSVEYNALIMMYHNSNYRYNLHEPEYDDDGNEIRCLILKSESEDIYIEFEYEDTKEVIKKAKENPSDSASAVKYTDNDNPNKNTDISTEEATILIG